MNLNETSFLDAKNLCMKRTTTNQKAINAQTNKSAPSATPHGEKAKVKKKSVGEKKNEKGDLVNADDTRWLLHWTK